MNVKVKLNHKNINLIKKIANEALVETADAVKSDLQQSQTMPFDTGQLQNRSTFVDDSKKNKGIATIVSDTPYARRLYFHPEYNFKKDKNANAGGEWFEPYINGNKKTYAQKTFNKIMKGKI
jgi:hypothetical protein